MESRKKRDHDWQRRVDEEVGLQRALQAEVTSWKAEKESQIETLESEKMQLEEDLDSARMEGKQKLEEFEDRLQSAKEDGRREGKVFLKDVNKDKIQPGATCIEI